jgi:hypothetical protein
MEQEHLIIVAILAVILYMIMKHSQNCNCGSCMQTKMVKASAVSPLGYIRTDDPNFATPLPERIRMRRDDLLPDPSTNPFHIRVSDKYIGAGQHIKQHIRYDNKNGMFNAMYSGNPLHIRYRGGDGYMSD